MKWRLPAILLAGAVCTCPAAFADGLHPMQTSDFWLGLGVYYPDHDISLSVNGSILGIGDEFELGGNLSDRAPLFSGEFGWQFSDNWSAAIQYFQTDRSDRYSVEEQIEWEDLVFDVGVDIKAGSDMKITRLVFSRKFIDQGPHDFRLAAGIHELDFGAFIEGSARLNDDSIEFRRASVAAEAPLPNIGAWYRYSPSEKWLFSVRLDWMSASIGDVSGTINNVVVGANYAFGESFGVGLQYQYFRLNGDVKDEFWRGEIDITYQGPVLALTGYW